MKTKAELVALRNRAIAFSSVNLALGLGAMIFSLSEQSVGWTFFVWLAGLQGVAIGLLGGIGYSQRLIGSIPPDWKLGPVTGFFFAVLTFWAPVVVTFLFGMMLYKTLPDAARPASSLDGGSGAGLMQSFVTFFNAGGCVWLVVAVVANKLLRSDEESAVISASPSGQLKELPPDRG